jgi:hypothetical protein
VPSSVHSTARICQGKGAHAGAYRRGLKDGLLADDEVNQLTVKIVATVGSQRSDINSTTLFATIGGADGYSGGSLRNGRKDFFGDSITRGQCGS